jgi:hypothetical protein
MKKTRRDSKPAAARRTTAAPPSLSPKAIAEETVMVAGVKSHYDRYLPVARDSAPATALVFRGDAALAHHNANLAVSALLAQRDALAATGFRVDFGALEAIPQIALALAYAVEQVEGRTGANADLQATLARARVLRDIGMSSVTTLVKSGGLGADDQKKLRKGSGPLNLAGELDALATLVVEKQRVFRNQSPFTLAHAKEAAELAAALKRQVTPKGGRKPTATALAGAQRDRDLLAALLVARYELLERAAGALWGRALEQYVPTLLSRVGVKPKKKAVAKPKGAKKKGEASGGAVEPKASAPTGAVTPDDGTG